MIIVDLIYYSIYSFYQIYNAAANSLPNWRLCSKAS